MRNRISYALLFSTLLLSIPRLAQGGSGIEGRWSGVIVAIPAEHEIDVTLEIDRDQEGLLKGKIWYPVQGTPQYDMTDIKVDGTTLSFHVLDEKGVASHFTAEIAKDGASFSGKLIEKLQMFPFSLQRSTTPSPWQTAAVLPLSVGAPELRSAFDQDIAHPRLLMILSPGSYSGRLALRLVQRYVLEQIKDPDLRVYVVWEPSHEGIPSDAAKRFSSLVNDPRVLQFWSGYGLAARSFKALLPEGGHPVTGMCLLFARGRMWGGAAPKPDAFRYYPNLGSKIQMPLEHQFNGVGLALDAQNLIARKDTLQAKP